MSRGNGRILTFYSFKGGVGRTMALANVAFLAATNGSRVLLMDWDLEAPGIPYYFRGHLDPIEEGMLSSHPGVLDMVVDWMQQVKNASSANDTAALTVRYEQSSTFETYTNVLVPPERLAKGGCLHVMTAGAAKGGEAGKAAYERTLADLSWPEFFGPCAGGLLVQALRTWAKSAYDLVLVDSRTGFADVAGICTVQLPDLVALCFVLNRQNLDGTAKVAAAIQRQRQGAVELRLVPMRLSREGTSEEADAQAFARDALRRTGLLTRERVDQDLQTLRIRAADGVPFYETLAPLVPPDPRKDPLTLDYATLAEALIGRSIEIAVDPSWREAVRRRLEPRQATPAYVAELELAEPGRARDEIDALLASASLVAETGKKLDEPYVDALIKAAFDIADRLEGDFEEQMGLLDGVLSLLRRLFERQPDVWRMRLVDTMERIITSHPGYSPHYDEVTMLEEMDGLLAGAAVKTALGIRRAALRQWIAREHLMQGNMAEALASSDVSDGLLAAAEAAHPTEHQRVELREAAIQGNIVRGDIKLQTGDNAGAVAVYSQARDLAQATGGGNPVTEGTLLLRLVRANLACEPQRAADPALAWARRHATPSSVLAQLPIMASAAAAAHDPAGTSTNLIRALFPIGALTGSERLIHASRYAGLAPATRVLIAASKLAALVPEAQIDAVGGMIATVVQILPRNVLRGLGLAARGVEARPAIDELIGLATALHMEDAASKLTLFAEQLDRVLQQRNEVSGQNDESA